MCLWSELQCVFWVSQTLIIFRVVPWAFKLPTPVCHVGCMFVFFWLGEWRGCRGGLGSWGVVVANNLQRRYFLRGETQATLLATIRLSSNIRPMLRWVPPCSCVLFTESWGMCCCWGKRPSSALLPGHESWAFITATLIVLWRLSKPIRVPHTPLGFSATAASTRLAF